MTLQSLHESQALQTIRQQQNTLEWNMHYDKRAGIEGTLSQGTRPFGLRQGRYVERAKI
jgi:hypothetical protein